MKNNESTRMTQRKAEKRQAILEAGYDTFSKVGYHNAKISDIAVQAGVGKGTIYEYFPSKRELFQAIIEDRMSPYEGEGEELQAAWEANVPLREIMEKILTGNIKRCMQQRDFGYIILQEFPDMEVEMREWFIEQQKKKVNRVREELLKVTKRQAIRPVNIDILSFVIIGIMSSASMAIITGEWTGEAEELAHHLTDIVLNGVAAQ